MTDQPAHDTGEATPDEAKAHEFEAITSQEALDQIISKRLERERRKYADYDDLKAKAAQADDTAAKLAQAQARLDQIEADQQRAQWVSQVSEETGVPAELLRGNTLEELQAHGEALKDFVKKPSAPILPKQGDAPTSSLTVEQKLIRELFGN